jgi:hypothetical protein
MRFLLNSLSARDRGCSRQECFFSSTLAKTEKRETKAYISLLFQLRTANAITLKKLSVFHAQGPMLHEVSTRNQKTVIVIRPRKTGKLVLSFVEVSRQSADKSLSR